MRRLLEGGLTFFRTLAHDGTLAEAVDLAIAEASDFDVVGNLTMLVESNVVTELRECN
jgi:hypothetical protein